jgi:Bax protein
MTHLNLKKIFCLCFVWIFLIVSCGEKPNEQTDESNKDPRQPPQSDQVGEKTAPPVETPDFASFTDVKEKKKAFFDYIYYFVEKVNLEVLERRVAIDTILDKAPEDISEEDRAFIDEMSELYLKDHDSSDTLASAKILQDYIRVIPPSLALAQAANESAWGTSRFATDANNFFGQWCFKKGCGLVPSQRNSGQVHEVRKFNTPEGSVRSYVRNLNTHYTYDELREIRDKLYQKEKLVTGMDLAEGLTGYSERGEEYVHELQSMIRVNKLVEYDRQFWQSVEEE